MPADNDTLALFEPDFQSMPVRFVDSISNTLLHVFIQKSVTDSLGLESELDLPSLADSATICTNFAATDGFIMHRTAPDAADSGWFLGCDSAAHDHQEPNNLQRISLYEVATQHEDRIIPFLGLPPDTGVQFFDSVPHFSRGGTELTIRPGSYLHKKYGEEMT